MKCLSKNKKSNFKYKVAFIGSGNMAEALINGFISKDVFKPETIVASDILSKRLSFIKKRYGINVTKDNRFAIINSEIIIIAVKPNIVKEILSQYAGYIKPLQIVISIAAGISTNFIESFLSEKIPVIRTMPNTPALLGIGAIGISSGRYANKKVLNIAKRLFSSVGKVVDVPQDMMNAITAVSGSGPAYVFYLAEALEIAGQKIGLPSDISKILTYQTIYGAGNMLNLSGLSAQELRQKVTSPGGTTQAAIDFLDRNRFFDLIYKAVEKAYLRASELTK